MDDLISREEACACIGKMIKEYREKGEDDLADGMILARRYGIKRLPIVDAAPVVRCKDCKHFEAASENEGNCSINASDDHDFWISNDWYCADGERRESE